MKSKGYLFFGLLLAALLLCGGGVLAQTRSGASTGINTGFDLTWWTVDGGGGTVNGGGYTLMGTAGQADAGPALTGGSYTLAGGYWVGDLINTPPTPTSETYLPIVLRNRN